jgi:Ca2+-binding RTX toxin-like protein
LVITFDETINSATVNDTSIKMSGRQTGEIYALDNTQLGDIIVNEIFQNPSAVSDANGEWFELYNPTANDIDINGWTLADNDLDSHTINNGAPLMITAGGYLILGRNADSGTNGGVAVDYEYSRYILANGDDEIILTNTVGVEIDRVDYDGGLNFPDPTGASMSLLNPTLDNNVGVNWVTSNTTYGAGDFGTPGAANGILSTVSLTASDTDAAESPADTAAFTVSRDNTGGVLTVVLNLGGDATGSDYRFSTGTVMGHQLSLVIPDGQASVMVTVTAVDDGWVEANETLTVGLASDAAYIVDDTDNVSSLTFASDDTFPVVTSITRVGDQRTNAASVDYLVTFNRAVSGVDATDFVRTVTGITGAIVTNATTTDDITYTVTVNTGIGDGILRLDLSDNNSITDNDTNLLGGPGLNDGDFTTGECYTIDKTAPANPAVTSLTDDSAADDTITRDTTLVFAGVADGGSAVELFLDGNAIGTVMVTGGTWSFDYTGTMLTDGAYILTATATDAAGNVSPISAGFDFTIDTTAPTVTDLVPSVATIQDANVGSDRFALIASFSEAMDTSVEPTLTFPTHGEDPIAILTFNSGTWTDATTYVASYDVTDVNENIPNIDVQVAGAQDMAGNVISGSVQADRFSIGLVTRVEFSATRYTISEDVGTSDGVTLTRSGDLSGTTTVQVNLDGGTATGNGIDYIDTGFPLTVTFAEAETTKTIALPILGDELVEGDETVTLSVVSVRNAAIAPQATATVTITDNDTAGFTLSKATAAVGEDGSTDTFVITLDAAPLTPVTFAVSSDDTGEVGGSPATVSLDKSNWNTGVTVTLTGQDDPDVDGNQTTTVSVQVMAAQSDAAFAGLSAQTVHVTTTDDDAFGFTPFDDNFTGTGAQDVEFALAGDDTLRGLGGNDRLAGQVGNDNLLGGDGDDTLIGSNGTDTATGGRGNDRMLGGQGRDRIVGNAGNDYLVGGDGMDSLLGGVGADTLIGGVGNDRLFGGSGNDRMRGNLGHDPLNGGVGNDVLLGGNGNDTLNGQGGNDRIRGGAGRDVIRGGLGNDRLSGELGNDRITTGNGRDRITIRRGHGFDRVTDFTNGQDRIILGGLRVSDLTIRQQNSDVLICSGSDRLLLLQNTHMGQINAADFV